MLGKTRTAAVVAGATRGKGAAAGRWTSGQPSLRGEVRGRRSSATLVLLVALAAGFAGIAPEPAHAAVCQGENHEGYPSSPIGAPNDPLLFTGLPGTARIGAKCRLFRNGPLDVVWYQSFAPGTRNNWNLRYGQRRNNRTPIFSHTKRIWKEPTGDHIRGSWEFALRELPANQQQDFVYAFFSVQACNRFHIGSSTCSKWSPVVTVPLDNLYLIAN